VEENQTDWDLHLQPVMLAYRSTVQDTTGYTPHFLMTGRQLNLPVDVMFRDTQQSEARSPRSDYVDNVRQAVQAAYEHVRQNGYAVFSEAAEGLLRPPDTWISVQRR
jgi:hypothetical protein